MCLLEALERELGSGLVPFQLEWNGDSSNMATWGNGRTLELDFFVFCTSSVTSASLVVNSDTSSS